MIGARDGTLLHVDYERGVGWVATHYDLSMRVSQQVRGSDEDLHRVAACWARGLEMAMRIAVVAETSVTSTCQLRDRRSPSPR